MIRERFSNGAESTLASSITADDTTLTVVDASRFPSLGNFNIHIGNDGGDRELALVTAVSGNTFTIQRGLEGHGFETAGIPLAFSAGIPVTQVLSVRSVNRWGQDNLALWNSDRPALARILNDAGDGVLVASDFTTIGSGATFTDAFGTIQTRKPTGSTLSGKVKSAPLTPYSIVAAFQGIVPTDDLGASAFFGLGFRKSSDGKAFFIALNSATSGKSFQWFASQYNGADDTFAESVFPAPLMVFGAEVFLKVEDDGTNLKFYIGDGIDWILMRSQSRTAFMAGGPDQVGWFVKSTSNTPDVLVRLVHWSVA